MRHASPRPEGACFTKVFALSLMGLVSWRHLFLLDGAHLTKALDVNLMDLRDFRLPPRSR